MEYFEVASLNEKWKFNGKGFFLFLEVFFFLVFIYNLNVFCYYVVKKFKDWIKKKCLFFNNFKNYEIII